jgi:predicted enzyme related to lactoylglutathione lyase
MPGAELNLIVLRSIDLERSARFYGALGIAFVRERHGNGPEHFAGEVGRIVFEIYPHGTGEATVKTRIGFSVDSLSALIPELQEAGGTVVSLPQESPWGMRAVVADPDGHRVELIERDENC